MNRLWVDDLREDPDTQLRGTAEPEGWVWAKTSAEALAYLMHAQARGDLLEEVSLDHDLGYVDGREDRGTLVLSWMIAMHYWPKVLTIHTANPVARDRMLQAVNAESPDWVDIRYIIR